ncbi:MAG TPA: hypothetical protein VGE14_14515 [Marmoricola sp.]
MTDVMHPGPDIEEQVSGPGRDEGLFHASTVLLGLAFATALSGLLVDDLYRGPDATAAMFRAYDLVTVLVVTPVLAIATLTLHRRSRAPTLATTGLAAYLVYTYAYYLFGTGFNDAFLAHVAVFVAGLVTLVLGLRAVDRTGAPPLLLARARARLVAVLIGVLTLSLAGMWVWVALDNALNGTVPAGSQLVETEAVVRLGMVLDLSLLVPFYAVAVALLWRGRAWGFHLGAVALASGLLHQVSYLVAMPVQVAADVPGAVGSDPLEPVIVVVYLLAAVLLARARRSAPARRRADSTG